MKITEDYVAGLFERLRSGDSGGFFEKVSDDVRWTVMGTHPLAGDYRSKENFLSHSFRRLNPLLKEGVVLKVKSLLVKDATAVVEMESLSTARNGKPFNNSYCWVTRFDEEGVIVEVRAYVDSALVQRLIDENEPQPR